MVISENKTFSAWLIIFLQIKSQMWTDCLLSSIRIQVLVYFYKMRSSDEKSKTLLAVRQVDRVGGGGGGGQGVWNPPPLENHKWP